MIFEPVKRLTVFYEPEEGRRIRVGQFATKAGQIFFEYAADFLATRLELSPFRLPLRPGHAEAAGLNPQLRATIAQALNI